MEKVRFGTDGIRGVAGRFPMDPPTARALGRVLGRGGQRVAVARDTRTSGAVLAEAVLEGAGQVGGSPVRIGVLPTPGLSHILSLGWADVGVMVTASHNPAGDNGLKVLRADGRKPEPHVQDAIEEALNQDLARPGSPDPAPSPVQDRGREAMEVYVAAVLDRLPSGPWLEGRRIVADGAHGAGWWSLPRILSSLGATVLPLACDDDGALINDGCGAQHPEAMARAVVEQAADAGIALDGDADRGRVCASSGRVLDGDEMLFLLALGSGATPPPAVVGTHMTGMGLEAALRRVGVGLVRTDVGDRFVEAEMRARGLPLGGERSGHVCLLDGLPTSDGALTALRILAGGLHLDSRLAAYVPFPYELTALRLSRRVPLEGHPGLEDLLSQARERLGPQGRVFLRYSGTEPVLRVLVEGPDPVAVQGVAREVSTRLSSLLGS